MRRWLCVVLAVVSASNEPVDYVNLLAGSFTKGDDFSTGNTLPLVGRPWGFNHWSLMTNSGHTSWWFGGNEHEFQWLRCTHQPSPWIGDYGWFMLGPQMGGYTSSPVGFFEPRAADLKPHAMRFTTAPDGMRVELAPTMHGAVLRVTFPSRQNHDKRICVKLGGGSGDHWARAAASGGVGVDARTNRNSGGAGVDFGHFLHFEAGDGANVEDHGTEAFCFGYSTSATSVEVKIATSFISHDQALHNFKLEVEPHAGYDSVSAESRAEWNALLSRAKPSGLLQKDGAAYYAPLTFNDAADFRDATIFYTGLYRGLTFPRRLDEPDPKEAGSTHHWSPYATRASPRTHAGVVVTDNGFWDTFRTVYPMLSLIYPDHLKWIVEGWVNAYLEGGWLPKWASPGYRASMVGTYGDVVLADAIVKKVGGFDERAAYAALKKDAFDANVPSGGAQGKVGLDQYEQYGYIPYDSGVSDCVSRTLDFAHADWATANAADVLGERGDAQKLRARAERALSALFDSGAGLMRPRGRRGDFKSNFVPERWGDGYTEGSAWHHSFPAWDVDTLARLHGGKDKLLAKLNELVTTAATFDPGGYGQTIHEMREMRALAMGQYGHNNQPTHHILYLFALAGDRLATNTLVRRTIRRAYGVDYYAGDEDNGEMGSWFVLSAIGLFDAAPGSEDYVLGAPLFDKMTLTTPASDGAGTVTLEIFAHRNSKDDVDVREVTYGNARIDTPTIRYSALRSGGELHFTTNGATRVAAAAQPPARVAAAAPPPPQAEAPEVDRRRPPAPEDWRPEPAIDVVKGAIQGASLRASALRDHLTPCPDAGGGEPDAPTPLLLVGIAALGLFLLGRVSVPPMRRAKKPQRKPTHVV
ncbi:glycosyl hydrolase family 92-domain-containing protein [Pelagophyceae sp. CCMP2097]|nr:glycosyl hydrolase family 92-domain-containing protein [Pelagophyceae sp. CCMP2097]